MGAWLIRCENCAAFHEARRADEREASDGTQHFEFVCNTCHSILLTFQRLGTQSAESKPARPILTARCPHCGDLNIFPGFDQILAYVCQDCGEGVDVTLPVQ
jgi:hypothetical protein